MRTTTAMDAALNRLNPHMQMKYTYDKKLGRVVEKPEKPRDVIKPLPLLQVYGEQALRLIEELKYEMTYGHRR